MRWQIAGCPLCAPDFRLLCGSCSACGPTKLTARQENGCCEATVPAPLAEGRTRPPPALGRELPHSKKGVSLFL